VARPKERGLPFVVEDEGVVVLVHRFASDLWRFAVDLERDLPMLRDAVRARLDRGVSRFLFDVRDVDPFWVYPVVKWGAMYGVVQGIRRRNPALKFSTLSEFRAAFLPSVAVVAGGEDQCTEIRAMKFDLMFGIYESMEQARAALAACTTAWLPRA
jgi:hypothetical protein